MMGWGKWAEVLKKTEGELERRERGGWRWRKKSYGPNPFKKAWIFKKTRGRRVKREESLLF